MPLPRNSVHGAVTIDQKVIEHHLRRIYERENPAGAWIESGMYRAVRDILESAVDQGTSSQRAVHGSQPSSPSPDLAAALKRSADVFAAHKVHRIQQDMARLLVDDQGNLRSFREWRELVTPIAAHQVGPWLETEYSTAVLRAQQAVEWQQFEAEADVLPNLRWVPSTAVHPGADHQVFWNTILPIHHPFWDQHRPGDRWNCHCSLEATDEHPTAPPKGFASPGRDQREQLRGNGPQPGLNENPGKTGRLFAQSHPYFPQTCAQCAFYQGGIANGFKNAQRNCENCPGIAKAINKGNFSNVTDDMKELHNLKGKDYYQMIQKLTKYKIYEEVEKGIYSAINESDKDYNKLMSAARKAVFHGYEAYLLPNPSDTRSGDFILVRKNTYKLFDVKTVSGKSSIGSQLMDSIGQTRRVFLNLSVSYSTKKLAVEIEKYFEANDEALEVIVAVGKKLVSVERDFVSDKKYYANIRRLIELKKAIRR